MRFSTRIAGALAAAGIAVLGASACTPAQIQAAQAQNSSAGARAVSAAESVLGAPFVWGGSSPGGFDCSGLTRWSYGQAGVYLPGGSYNQINYGYPVGWNDLRRLLEVRGKGVRVIEFRTDREADAAWRQKSFR